MKYIKISFIFYNFLNMVLLEYLKLIFKVRSLVRIIYLLYRRIYR